MVRSAALPCSPLRIPVATYREEAVRGVSSQNFIAAGSFQTCEPFWTSRFINLVSNFKTLDKLKPKNRNLLTKEFGTIEKLYLCLWPPYAPIHEIESWNEILTGGLEENGKLSYRQAGWSLKSISKSELSHFFMVWEVELGNACLILGKWLSKLWYIPYSGILHRH